MMHNNAQQELDVPDHLTCPVSLLIYSEPVTVYPSGKTYEKEILQALAKVAADKQTEALCPLTRIPIQEYREADDVKLEVKQYLEANSNAHNQVYIREKSEENYPFLKITDKKVEQQITDDEAFARELQCQEENEYQIENAKRIEREKQDSETKRTQELQQRHAIEESLKQAQMQLQERIAQDRIQREKQSFEAYRQQQLQQQRAKEEAKAIVRLTYTQAKERDTLVDDIQNLIYALGFERGPQPRGRIDNFALVFFAMVEKAFLEPLPWQKIKVRPGPKPNAMYSVMQASIRALKETNPAILENAKAEHEGQYDLVKTWFGGEKSLAAGGYVTVAKNMGTISYQPGDLVSSVITRADLFLQEIGIEKVMQNRLII